MTAQGLAPRILFAVYDQALQEIDRPYECQRDAQTWCDEHNNEALWERYVVETTDSSEWAEDQVRWADQ